MEPTRNDEKDGTRGASDDPSRRAALLAHELRNPLGVIESSAFLIGEIAKGDAGIQRHVDRIARQVERARALIESVLVGHGLRSPRLETFHLFDVATTAARDVDPDGARVSLEALPADLAVVADPFWIHQILVNLFTNAVRAAPASRVRLAAEPSAPGVRVLVTDNGPGFPAWVLDRLPEGGRSTHAGGHGLGLSLCRELLASHGSELKLANGVTGGAEVSFVLPGTPSHT